MYYIEYNNAGKIISYGSATSLENILQNTTGTVMQVDEQTYSLVAASYGKIDNGIKKLNDLRKKLANMVEF